MLWESCLDEVQEMVKTLEDSHGRPQKRSWSAKMLSPVPEKDIPLEQRQTELALFSRRSATVLLAIGLLKFYNHFDDTRARRCNDVMKSTIRDIKKVSTLNTYLKDQNTPKRTVFGNGALLIVYIRTHIH